MTDVPAQWQALIPAVYAIRTIFELFRHPAPIKYALLGVAAVVIVYFGVDPVAAFGWTFNAGAWQATAVKVGFNALLLAGGTLDGHDLIRRVTGK